MSAATTKGIILKAEFTWTIRDVFTWPEKNGEKLTSPLFHAVNDEETKWALVIQKDPWSQESLGLFLCLSACPSSKPTVAAKFSSLVADEQGGKVLYEKKGDDVPLPFSLTSGNTDLSLLNGRVPMGNRQQFQRIPSVSIRFIVEYEKGILIENTTSITSAAPSLVNEIYYPNCWRSDFDNLFTSQSNSDISFIIDGQEIKAHKLIMSARSPVFAAMFDSDMKEKDMNRIDIPGVSPGTFIELLRFIYTDQVKLTEGNVEAILAASNQYLLPLLKSKCEEFIVKRLSIENCIEMMILADLHNAMFLKMMTQVLFCSRHTEIRKTEKWKTMKKFHAGVAVDVLERLLELHKL